MSFPKKRIKNNLLKKSILKILCLRIFFFEKSKIFQIFFSKKSSLKFYIKVYKDFWYKDSYKLRRFYYITKDYYLLLLKKYKNFKKFDEFCIKDKYNSSKCIFPSRRRSQNLNGFYLLNFFQNSLNYSNKFYFFDNKLKLDEIFWELNELLYKFKNFFIYGVSNSFYYNNFFDFIENYYKFYYFRKFVYKSFNILNLSFYTLIC